MLWRHQPISLQIKKYTEIQEWYFKWQIQKYLKHVVIFENLKYYPDLAWLLASYCLDLTKFKFWPDPSLNITLMILGFVYSWFLQNWRAKSVVQFLRCKWVVWRSIKGKAQECGFSFDVNWCKLNVFFSLSAEHVDEALTPAPLADKSKEHNPIFKVPLIIIPGKWKWSASSGLS